MNLKVLKLRSGEEIACEVLEETSDKLIISRPMIFKFDSMMDLTGKTIDVTSLENWLGNNTSKNITIPTNHIVFISEANESTIKLYNYELSKEKVKSTTNDNKVVDSDLFGMFLENMLKDMASSTHDFVQDSTPKQRKKAKRPSKKEYLPPDMTDESELDRHMIMMQLYIPAEAIMNLITAGILDPKTLLKMISEVKKRNKFTGDEKDRRDFGSKLSDWNPDPNSDDYK